MPTLDSIAARCRAVAPAAGFYTVRIVEENKQRLMVRRGVTEPVRNETSLGVHITVHDRGGAGYAATCDISQSGLRRAFQSASRWARATANITVLPDSISYAETAAKQQKPHISIQNNPQYNQASLSDRIDMLQTLSQSLTPDSGIIDDWAALYTRHTDSLLVTAKHDLYQSHSCLTPYIGAVANRGTETQKRSYGLESSRQAPVDAQLQATLMEKADTLAHQALALLSAPNCPTETCELLLMPNQMTLQIHESIGHPLELDRILGDERNYAGTSFVTPEMFGHYRYGSELLNVVFDPDQAGQIASYGYDDDGTAARREYLIQQGILQRPLGAALSQQRAGLPGVANSRSCSWNRPAIDRMANINMEPGECSLDNMIESVETGILMDTNRSWSIDDSRNKFQFGCEIGWLIRNGERKQIVKNPNYRGISSHFWRNLSAVGNRDSFELLSVSNCGKGEPNQAIEVGHAAPACLFSGIDVFGGHS